MIACTVHRYRTVSVQIRQSKLQIIVQYIKHLVKTTIPQKMNYILS